MPHLRKDWQRRDDLKLIRKAKNGDVHAFAALVKKYQRQVYFLISKMTFSHHITDDLVQETFIRVFKSLNRFDEAYPFYPWLRKIAVNLTLNRLESESRRKATSLEDLNPYARADSNISQDLEQKELMQNLVLALNSLPEEQRIVFVLRTQEEMSYEEISQALDITMGTVMSRLSRARNKLKKLLQDYL